MDKPAHLFDRRTVKRNMAAGLITKDEYQAWLDSLDDCGDSVVVSDVKFEHRARFDHTASGYTDADDD
ncbi:MAG: hypothetical protein H6742_19900 [Alphaproteobacteria bacterium]|nr:hypothetical protein [Alphaproteobacteria bacterium]